MPAAAGHSSILPTTPHKVPCWLQRRSVYCVRHIGFVYSGCGPCANSLHRRCCPNCMSPDRYRCHWQANGIVFPTRKYSILAYRPVWQRRLFHLVLHHRRYHLREKYLSTNQRITDMGDSLLIKKNKKNLPYREKCVILQPVFLFIEKTEL